MQKIKIALGYKLLATLLVAKPSVKRTFIITLSIPLISLVLQLAISGDPTMLIVVGIVILLLIVVGLFFREVYYEPKKSYKGLRDVAQEQIPEVYNFIIKYFPVIGIIGGLIVDIACAIFPGGIILLGGGFCLIAYFTKYMIKNKPEYINHKHIRMQLKNHQNIDYNAKVDLNEIYGVNDKLLLSYQNFDFSQKRLEDGDFIVGVSPLGIYFAHKKNVIQKLFVKFGDIDTIGILPGLGNVFVFHIRTIRNTELNIIIDATASLAISPHKLFDKLLNALDEFLLNGSVASTTVERRRRVVTTPSTVIATTPRVESSTSGRAIDMDTTTETIKESSDNTNRRVIDIEFTPEVVAELAQGSFIEANRSIDVF